MPQRIAALRYMAITIPGEINEKAATSRMGWEVVSLATPLGPLLAPRGAHPHTLASCCPCVFFFRNMCSGLSSERQARPAEGEPGCGGASPVAIPDPGLLWLASHGGVVGSSFLFNDGSPSGKLSGCSFGSTGHPLPFMTLASWRKKHFLL